MATTLIPDREIIKAKARQGRPFPIDDYREAMDDFLANARGEYILHLRRKVAELQARAAEFEGVA